MDTTTMRDLVLALPEKHCALVVVSVEVLGDAYELAFVVQDTLEVVATLYCSVFHLRVEYIDIVSKVFELIDDLRCEYPHMNYVLI
jgi:hypothetical protein